MKAPKIKISVFLAAVFAFAGIAQAQEYDDMYFTKKDRKATQESKMSINKNLPSAQTEETTEYVIKNENAYSEEHVNPEYLARYGNESNSAQYSNDEYYTETANTGDDYQVPVVNNYYYNQGPGFYNPMYVDPWFAGYNPWFSRWRFNVSFGFGWGWNSWYRPSWGWGPSIGWGWNSWYGSAWNVGWGYGWGNSWGYGWGSPYWGNPYWGGGGFWGYPGYGNVVIVNNYESRYNRTFRNGAGPSRANTAVRERTAQNDGGRFTSRTGDSYGKAGTTSRVASSTASRRYIDPNNSVSRSRTTQSDYYRRSQTTSRAVSNDVNSRYSGSRTSTASRGTAYSSPSSNYSTRTRGSAYNSSSRSGYTQSSAPSYRQSSGYNNTRSGSSYQRSTPSRSSGTYRNSSPSRSNSSGSYRSSSPSRSSGSSPSMRSSGGSRSSGSSGVSRSSSGGSSRSSSGSTRRGN